MFLSNCWSFDPNILRLDTDMALGCRGPWGPSQYKALKSSLQKFLRNIKMLPLLLVNYQNLLKKAILFKSILPQKFDPYGIFFFCEYRQANYIRSDLLSTIRNTDWTLPRTPPSSPSQQLICIYGTVKHFQHVGLVSEYWINPTSSPALYSVGVRPEQHTDSCRWTHPTA